MKKGDTLLRLADRCLSRPPLAFHGLPSFHALPSFPPTPARAWEALGACNCGASASVQRGASASAVAWLCLDVVGVERMRCPCLVPRVATLSLLCCVRPRTERERERERVVRGEGGGKEVWTASLKKEPHTLDVGNKPKHTKAIPRLNKRCLNYPFYHICPVERI